MKLYNVPRNSTIRVLEDVRIPPESSEISKGEILYFEHMDGMYSRCKRITDNTIVFIAAWTEVEIVGRQSRC